MNKFIKYFVLPIILFSFQISLVGQALPDIEYLPWDSRNSIYSAARVFPDSLIADDFGPRRLNDNWHGGIDYNGHQGGNADKWSLILAPEGGTIVDVNNLYMAGGYKQFCYESNSGNYRYIFGHVYDNSNTAFNRNAGTIHLKRMIPSNTSITIEKWAQIFIYHGDTLVLGQVPGNVVLGSDTLLVSTTVTAGQPIAPIGTSSTEFAHLHLNTIPVANSYSTGSTTWNKNPLRHINYNKATTVPTLYTRNNATGVDLVYPGDAISPLASRVEMTNTTVSGPNQNRYSHTFDIDKVRFFIKPQYELNTGYKIIKGPQKRSEIIYGGVVGENLVNHPLGSFGNWSITGIDSRAYNGQSAYSNQPYDIFHYSDFYHRIHEQETVYIGNRNPQMADCPQDARYNDGPYNIISRYYSIQEDSSSSTIQDVVIDNFQPFVQSVNVQINEKEVYDMEWECNGNCVVPRGGTNGYPGTEYDGFLIVFNDLVQGLNLTVETSEPMEEFETEVIAFRQVLPANAVRLLQVSDDRTVFQYHIGLPAEVLRNIRDEMGQDNDIQFIFTGQDYAIDGQSANPLLALENYFHPDGSSANTSCLEVPTRISVGQANDWDNPMNLASGQELAHHFGFNCGSSGGRNLSRLVSLVCCPGITNIETEITPDCGNNNGAIDLMIEGPNLDSLRFHWSNGDTTQHVMNLRYGFYSVTITDLENGCEVEVDSLEVPRDEESGPVLTETITPACTPNTGNIQIDFGNSPPPYSAQWSTGAPGNVIENLNAGDYSVTVSDATGCTRTYTYTVPGPPNLGMATVTPASCQSRNDGMITLNLPAGETYEITWSDGMGSGQRTRSGLAPAVYGVTVTSEGGCSSERNNLSTKPEGAQRTFPYVKRALVLANGTPIYDGRWMPDANNCLHFVGGTSEDISQA